MKAIDKYDVADEVLVQLRKAFETVEDVPGYTLLCKKIGAAMDEAAEKKQQYYEAAAQKGQF